MLTIFTSPKAMNYNKLIDFLNKRKNIELNRFKQRGNKDIKDIEYRINKETGQPELLELLLNGGHYIQELVANDILDLSQYMFLTHEYVDDGFNMEIVLHGIFATLEDVGDPEHEEIVAVVPGDYINYTAYKEALDDDPWYEY